MLRPFMRYFDNNATTAIAPEVLQAMMPFLTEAWGNPSSVYRFGHEIGRHLDRAREQVAALIGAEPREIVFTSCGTESNNTAIQSALATTGKRHVVTTAVEHAAVGQFCERLERQGFEVTILPVTADGALDLARVERAIRPDTAIVSVMLANNETGILFPVSEVAALCRRRGVLCHTDAVQAAGKIPLDVRSLGVDFLSLSAHKLHAPKGIGLLYIKRRTRFAPYLVGGHQEVSRRAGTENVPYIVGFGQAAELAMERLGAESIRIRTLRDRLEEELLAHVPDTARNGAAEPRLPNTSNLAFGGVEAEAVLMLLDQAGICASSGSACSTGSLNPSHVLAAMGFSAERALSSIRFSLGFYNTPEDVACLARQLPSIVARLRGLAPAPPVDGATAPRADSRPANLSVPRGAG